MGLRKRDKKAKDLPPPPGLPPMPAPPAPGMPLPPAPGMPLPPAPGMPIPTPQPATMPSPPAQPAAPEMPAAPVAVEPAQEQAQPAPETPVEAPQGHAIEALPPSPAPEIVEEPEVKESYAGLYAKKSGKPLQQVYGHIDRIGEGEIGSLLDRYSDRFGHELDRDIIVMRKEERDDKIAEIRDSPTVQLLNEEEEESHLDGETLVELNSQLQTVEEELRRLKPEYQAAKKDGDRELLRELRPHLEQLMADRKLIKAVIAGEAELDELLASQEEDSEDYDDEEEEVYVEDDSEEDYEEEDDVFIDFVSIIDSFLGELPESEVIAFTQTEDFSVYKTVASDPENADDDERAEFFHVVDTLLGGMPDDAISEFTKSEDFEIYRAVGALYS